MNLDEMSAKIDRQVSELMRTRAVWIDALIAACLRENGCKASELQLVEIKEGLTFKWYVEKRPQTSNPKESKNE